MLSRAGQFVELGEPGAIAKQDTKQRPEVSDVKVISGKVMMPVTEIGTRAEVRE